MRLQQHSVTLRILVLYRASIAACFTLAIALVLLCPVAMAATSFDGNPDDMDVITGNQWWFDFHNWSGGAGVDGTSDPPNYLPPLDDSGAPADAQINDGLFLGAEGVVYDPDTDPFYNDPVYMAQFSFPSPLGPQDFWRLYMSRNTTNTNLLTIKSGNMTFHNNPVSGDASTVIIGRSGSTAMDSNLGLVNQLGGSVSIPLTNLDMGNREASGWGNGTWNYEGGNLDVALDGAVGIRLSSGSTNATTGGAGGIGTFIMHNPGEEAGGHVRTYSFIIASASGIDDAIQDDKDPDGETRGVGIVEFHYENGATRPIQVLHNLTINNGNSDVEVDPTPDDGEDRIRSSRLSLVLDEAPVVDMSGVPIDLGLFSVNYGDTGGAINGTGDIDGNATPNEDTDQVFSNLANTGIYSEGSIVEATFGLSTYRWNISYTGKIHWLMGSEDDSILDPNPLWGGDGIEGAGSGIDVVLIGLDSTIVAGLAGDYNEDDSVDAADYTTWRDAVTAGLDTLPNRDPLKTNGSDLVGESDFLFWRNHFGDTLPGAGSGFAAAGVPEPGSLVLAVLAVLGLMSFRRRQN